MRDFHQGTNLLDEGNQLDALASIEGHTKDEFIKLALNADEIFKVTDEMTDNEANKV